MRSIFTIILFNATLMNAIAQMAPDTPKHLMFNGMQIDGSINTFVAQAKIQGFRHIVTHEGLALLEGDFAYYKNCFVGVTALRRNGLVSRIGVLLPERDSWSMLESDYFAMKEWLVKNYGEASASVQEFISDIPPLEDHAKLRELGQGKCRYLTTYQTREGRVELSINHKGNSSFFVQVIYSDTENMESVGAGLPGNL